MKGQKDDLVKLKSLAKLAGDLLGSRIPVIQGGMGIGISLARLRRRGGQPGWNRRHQHGRHRHGRADFLKNFLEANIRALRREIRKVREATRGILGVNIMVAMSNFTDMVKVAVEEAVDVIFAGAGLPLNLPELLPPGGKTRLVPIVSSAKAARIICRRWLERYGRAPDAVVVEGPKAGGHLGFKRDQIADPAFALERLVPEVIAELGPFEEKSNRAIPVVPAGGIYTGTDINRYLEMGAAGVQMATRFVTTDECDASIDFKRTYLAARREDIVIIDSPVGIPGRALRNGFIDDVRNGNRKPYSCPYHCLSTCDYEHSPYCIAQALMNAKKGRMKHGFAFVGANAGRERTIISVPGADGTAAGGVRGGHPAARRSRVGTGMKAPA